MSSPAPNCHKEWGQKCVFLHHFPVFFISRKRRKKNLSLESRWRIFDSPGSWRCCFAPFGVLMTPVKLRSPFSFRPPFCTRGEQSSSFDFFSQGGWREKKRRGSVCKNANNEIISVPWERDGEAGKKPPFQMFCRKIAARTGEVYGSRRFTVYGNG